MPATWYSPFGWYVSSAYVFVTIVANVSWYKANVFSIFSSLSLSAGDILEPACSFIFLINESKSPVVLITVLSSITASFQSISTALTAGFNGVLVSTVYHGVSLSKYFVLLLLVYFANII